MAYSTGKSAVITGAGSGIGRALAVHLNREGCRLHLCDIDDAALQETEELLERGDIAATRRLLDVGDRQGVHDWAAAIAREQNAVDLVINNAGVALIAPVTESNYEDIEWLLRINFWGVVHGTMAFLPLLQQAPRGHLVNVSSVFGLIGVPTQSAYNAAKFAVRGYTEALRQEMEGSNVDVLCVHPGGIRTNIARSGRSSDASVSADDRDARFREVAGTTPEAAASQIIKAVEKRKKRLLIGNDARYISFISRLLPVAYPRLLPRLGRLGKEGSAAADPAPAASTGQPPAGH